MKDIQLEIHLQDSEHDLGFLNNLAFHNLAEKQLKQNCLKV